MGAFCATTESLGHDILILIGEYNISEIGFNGLKLKTSLGLLGEEKKLKKDEIA